MKWKQGWNGLLISGMLGAGGILMVSEAQQRSPEGITVMRQRQQRAQKKGVLHRSWKVRQKVNSGQKILGWKKQIKD